VAHACNPSYSGGSSQKDHSSKSNSSWNPISKNPITKNWAGGVTQGEGPEFRPQCHKQNKTKKLENCAIASHSLDAADCILVVLFKSSATPVTWDLNLVNCLQLWFFFSSKTSSWMVVVLCIPSRFIEWLSAFFVCQHLSDLCLLFHLELPFCH
jgi:hypothetical protein